MAEEKHITPVRASPENISIPERPAERREKSVPGVSVPRDKGVESEVPPIPTIAAPAQSMVSHTKTQLCKDIERVLEEDLDYLYLSLSQEQREKFRTEGEKTAAAIETVLQRTKNALMEIIQLIREWIAVLPGVNKFFAEREAKIKAEKILFLVDDDSV
jgi:hypothetical protein